MKGLLKATLVVCVLAIMGLPLSIGAQEVLFVSDRDEPGNWDIYSVDISTQAVRRLTCDPAIDNHPDRGTNNQVVWSSTRAGGEEEDFEIFIATDDGGTCGMENGTIEQLTFNDEWQDRHPHFSHDGTQIVFSARYVCVSTIDTITVVDECSIPRQVPVENPCGRKCEAMKVYNLQTDEIIEIDHDMLTDANSEIWPERELTDARWVGHPSFSEDGNQILFSGAVDGEGRNWEVYVADWDQESSTVTGLRQITKGSTYPLNSNPIQMSAGAHFSEVDDTIIFGSTRTAFGNSQIFQVLASSDTVAVSDDNRLPASSDKANDYVPEPLADGRIVVTSDRDEYEGFQPCGAGIRQYTAYIDNNSAHTITIEAAGVADPPSSNVRIHLDAHRYGQVLREQDEGTTYFGAWTPRTSPNASMGTYRLTTGDANDYVEIAVPSGYSTVTLYLGRTPLSGIARIYIDGTPIDDGDALPDWSGLNLYTEFMTVSNDLDLVILDGASQTHLAANDSADDMLLIGDEVSWFCGLSPNLSLCTYLPKFFTMEQLCWMMNSPEYLPEYYPARCLYPIAYDALNDYMSGPNPLRLYNQTYWTGLLDHLCDPIYAESLVVLPTPVTYFIENEAPSVPSEGNAYVDGNTVILTIDDAPDPNGDAVTYDFLLSFENEPMILAARDVLIPEAVVHDLIPGNYSWQVVCKDCRGGLAYTDVWDFTVLPVGCEYIVGDYNGSGSFNVADIISAFSKLKTGSPDAALLCECPSGGGDSWAVAMDVNNSCSFNVADIISAFSKLKTGSPELIPCEDCPPTGGLLRADDNTPPKVPLPKSKKKVVKSGEIE